MGARRVSLSIGGIAALRCSARRQARGSGCGCERCGRAAHGSGSLQSDGRLKPDGGKRGDHGCGHGCALPSSFPRSEIWCAGSPRTWFLQNAVAMALALADIRKGSSPGPAFAANGPSSGSRFDSLANLAPERVRRFYLLRVQTHAARFFSYNAGRRCRSANQHSDCPAQPGSQPGGKRRESLRFIDRQPPPLPLFWRQHHPTGHFSSITQAAG